VSLDLKQQRHLSAGDPQRVRLAPELARELQQGGPQAICDGQGFER
jgi:hypothetical protein